MKIRTGRKNPHTIYLQVGDEPADDDLRIGFALDPEVVRLIGDGLTSPWHLNEIRLQTEESGR